MRQAHFFVSHDGMEMGPYTVDQILAMTNSGELAITDYLYDEDVKDWVLLMDRPEIAGQIRKTKPQGRPERTSVPLPSDDEGVAAFGEKTIITKKKALPENDNSHQEWYVLKGENRYGPFTYFDLLKLLQNKTVFEFDYVWKAPMETWTRIAELSDFAHSNIKNLKGTEDPELSKLFLRRRHNRKEHEGSLVLHDTHRVWHGKTLEVSEGGAGLVMNNAMILPGQTLYVHFRPCKEVPPFNAFVEIVSKRYIKGVNERNAPVTYGVKFLKLHEDAKQALREFTEAA